MEACSEQTFFTSKNILDNSICTILNAPRTFFFFDGIVQKRIYENFCIFRAQIFIELQISGMAVHSAMYFMQPNYNQNQNIIIL